MYLFGIVFSRNKIHGIMGWLCHLMITINRKIYSSVIYDKFFVSKWPKKLFLIEHKHIIKELESAIYHGIYKNLW